MCGRFTLGVTAPKLIKFLKDNFGIVADPETFNVPRFNVAPGQDIVSIIASCGSYRSGYLNWSYRFSPDGKGIINIRAESLSEKTTFLSSLRFRRCLVIADGFYEWRTFGKTKKPYWIRPADEKIFLMAGLWISQGEGKDRRFYAGVITHPADIDFEYIHHRMPVIFTPEQGKAWLDMNNKEEYLIDLLKMYPEQLAIDPVSTLVNDASVDDEKCLWKDDEE